MNLYYESVAVLLTMIELGQFLEATAKRKAGDAMGALLRLTPETALRLEAEVDADVAVVHLAARSRWPRSCPAIPWSSVPVPASPWTAA